MIESVNYRFINNNIEKVVLNTPVSFDTFKHWDIRTIMTSCLILVFYAQVAQLLELFMPPDMSLTVFLIMQIWNGSRWE